MRGISLVRTILVSEPNRKEKKPVKVQVMARCNASIPLDHKNFQNQYLNENANEAPKLPPPVKKKFRPRVHNSNSKLQKHKTNQIV